MSDQPQDLSYNFEAASNSLDTVRSDVDDPKIINKEGAYHCVAQDVELIHPKIGKNAKGEHMVSPPQARIKFKCVCSINGQSAAGSTLLHSVNFGGYNKVPGSTTYVELDETRMEFKHRAAIRAGLVHKVKTPEGKEILMNRATGEPSYSDAEFTSMKGRHYIVYVKVETGNDGRQRAQCKFDDFRLVDDPQVRSVPKNLEALQNAGYENAESMIDDGTGQAAATTSAAVASAVSATEVDDDF